MAYSAAQKKATSKYKQANYKRIPLDVPIAEYDAIKTHAAEQGESVNGFIRRAIREAIAQDEQERVSMEAAQQLAGELHDSPEHILESYRYNYHLEAIDKIFPGSMKAILSHEFSALREKYADK